jgi:RNA polymerase sigma factor (sigma-70 family)
MPSDRSNPLLRYIRRLAGRPGDDGATDGQLLDAFLSQRDEAAFETLLRRHGPMVLATCRRILRDGQEAEDAFQATFLVLCRKAGSIGKGEFVGSWLYQVACRIALKVRADAARRPVLATPLPDLPAPAAPPDLDWRDLRLVLDEELSRLPEKYRAPLVLHYLEGKTVPQVAQGLGWTPGTVAGRLARARERLRAGLTRRGVTLTAATLAAALSQQAGAGVLPATLVKSAVKVTTLFVLGHAAVPGAVAPKAAALAKAVLHAMLLTKLKVAAGVLLAVAVTATGAGILSHHVVAGKQAAEGQIDVPQPTVQVADLSPQKPVEEQRTRTDRYGDPLPEGAVARLGTVHLRHGSVVFAVALSGDGATLASGGNDGIVHIWETKTGKEIRQFRDTQYDPESIGLGAVVGLAYTPDGSKLAIARLNEPVCLFDVKTGKQLHHFGDKRSRAHWLAFSPDGKTLAYAGRHPDPNGLNLADVKTGTVRLRLEGHRDRVHGMAFSPDAKTLASASADKTVRLWDAKSGKELRQFIGHQRGVHSLAFSADGRTIASAGEDQTIRLWETATGKELQRLDLPDKPEREDLPVLVALSADGKILISAQEYLIRFWDLATGKEIRNFRGHGRSWIDALSLSGDGKTLASAGHDHNVRLWKVPSGEPLHPLQGPFGPFCQIAHVAFSPDSRVVVTGEYNDPIRLWEAATGILLREIPHRGCSAFLPGGKTLISGGWEDGKIRLWEVATGKELRNFGAHRRGLHGMATAPGGRLLASTGDDCIRLWEIASGRLVHDFGGKQKSFPIHIIFSPDGKLLASAHVDGNVLLWDVTSGRVVRQIPTETGQQVGDIAFSPDGKLLAWSGIVALGRERSIRLSDVATGQEVRRLPGHGDALDSKAFSPDGKTLVWGGQHFRMLDLWEVRTGKKRRTLSGHQGQITCFAFSPDGTMLASASADTTVLIWDLTGRLRNQRRMAGTTADLKNPERLWSDLAGEDAEQADRAMSLLKGSPDQAVDLLQKHLLPVPVADPRQIARLLGDLDSDRFAVRDRAVRELEQLWEGAEPALRRLLEAKPALEVRRRAESLLARLEPARLRVSRAIEVLEHTGTPKARKFLAVLAGGAPGAWLTGEAKASLERLARRPSTEP